MTVSLSALIGSVQVHDLEASNQRLEIQIQRELDRKCPQELRHLDKHLRAVCLLQQRVSGEAGTGCLEPVQRGVSATMMLPGCCDLSGFCAVFSGKVKQVETSLTFKCHPFKCQGVFLKLRRSINGQVCVRWFCLKEHRD